MIVDDIPWLSGPCECLDCGYEWVGVWPLGADGLERPKCASLDTVRDGYEV